jgi:hypothetical protein
MEKREFELSAYEANAVKEFMLKKAQEHGLKIITRKESLELGWDDETENIGDGSLDEVEVCISEMDYPNYPEKGVGWKYGGIEKTRENSYAMFAWGIKEDSPVDLVLISSVSFAKEFTGRDISADYF